MGNCDDDDFLWVDSIDQAIGKSIKAISPQPASKGVPGPGVFQDSLLRILEFLQ